MAKKPAANKRLEAYIRERLDALISRVPIGHRKKRGPCDAEQATYDALVAAAAQKQLEADDAFNDALAAGIALAICQNG